MGRIQLAGPRGPHRAERAQLPALARRPDEAITALNEATSGGWYEVSVRERRETTELTS